MPRPLFCQLSPWAYRISRRKEILRREFVDFICRRRFAETRGEELLPIVLYRHASLIRRKLGQVDPGLQENKAVNLALAAPHIDRILIRPGETFSFWRLVGETKASLGYREGLTISSGRPGQGVGGGLCQCTNLLHWLVLHSPLTIVERHHHNGLDLFPDFHRQVPFGVGTSIAYNYLDYRVENHTEDTYQFCLWSDGFYLNGELRCTAQMPVSYHIRTANEQFIRENGVWYRTGEVLRRCVDKRTGGVLATEVLERNHAQICYELREEDPLAKADKKET